VRAGQESAEAIVAKKAGESRQEQRSKNQETNHRTLEKSGARSLPKKPWSDNKKVTSKTALKEKGEWNSPANQPRGGEPATRRTKAKEGAE
jgi:hypothetical protein